jgi:hypothetical protein
MFNARKSVTSVLATAFVILVVPAAHADRCSAGYDISKRIKIIQGNGAKVDCQLQLTRGKMGPNSTGNFSGVCVTNSGNGSREVHGFIQKNTRFKMQVDWNGGSTGVYTGVLNDNGRLVDGRTFDASHPAHWSDWRIENSLPCK